MPQSLRGGWAKKRKISVADKRNRARISYHATLWTLTAKASAAAKKYHGHRVLSLLNVLDAAKIT
jgi:hypothetical protein